MKTKIKFSHKVLMVIFIIIKALMSKVGGFFGGLIFYMYPLLKNIHFSLTKDSVVSMIVPLIVYPIIYELIYRFFIKKNIDAVHKEINEWIYDIKNENR